MCLFFFLHAKGILKRISFLSWYPSSPTSVSKNPKKKSFEQTKKNVFGVKNISHSSFKMNLNLFLFGTTKSFNKCSIMRSLELRQQPAESRLNCDVYKSKLGTRTVYKPYSILLTSFTLIVTLKIQRQPQRSSQ